MSSFRGADLVVVGLRLRQNRSSSGTHYNRYFAEHVNSHTRSQTNKQAEQTRSVFS